MKQYQKKVDSWIKSHGVRYFSELSNMAILTEEVGELSSLVVRTYGDQSFKNGLRPVSIKESIADEMADIIFVVSCMANQMEIDLDIALDKNLIKKTQRDHSRHKENKKL